MGAVRRTTCESLQLKEDGCTAPAGAVLVPYGTATVLPAPEQQLQYGHCCCLCCSSAQVNYRELHRQMFGVDAEAEGGEEDDDYHPDFASPAK